MIPSSPALVIIRSKQDFGSSTIDHVSKNNQRKNARPAPKKPCPAKPFRSREIVAQPPSQYFHLLSPSWEIRPRSSRAPSTSSCFQKEQAHCRSLAGHQAQLFCHKLCLTWSIMRNWIYKLWVRFRDLPADFYCTNTTKTSTAFLVFPTFHKQPLPQLHNN